MRIATVIALLAMASASYAQPVTSFADVPSILMLGSKVVVTDATGKRIRGRVSSVSSDRLVLRRGAGVFSSAREWTYRSNEIDVIRVVDPHWNGVLLGLATSVGLVAAVERMCTRECQGAGAFGGIAAALAPFVGWGIDDSMNTRVYERRRPAARVTFAPSVRQRSVAAALLFSFR